MSPEIYTLLEDLISREIEVEPRSILAQAAPIVRKSRNLTAEVFDHGLLMMIGEVCRRHRRSIGNAENCGQESLVERKERNKREHQLSMAKQREKMTLSRKADWYTYHVTLPNNNKRQLGECTLHDLQFARRASEAQMRGHAKNPVFFALLEESMRPHPTATKVRDVLTQSNIAEISKKADRFAANECARMAERTDALAAAQTDAKPAARRRAPEVAAAASAATLEVGA